MRVFRKVPHIRLVADKAAGAEGASPALDDDEAEADITPLPEAEYRVNLRRIEASIRAHHGMLINWLAKKLGNAEDAADVAQDVYIRVHRFARGTLIENPQAFLFKTAANLAINELKRRHRVLQRHVTTTDEEVADTVAEVACEGPTPEEAMDRKQNIQALVDAIRNLPERARTAFIKNRFEGKTYGEIAAELGVSESTVEKYMMDALKRLRGRLVRPSESTVLPMPRRGRRGRS